MLAQGQARRVTQGLELVVRRAAGPGRAGGSPVRSRAMKEVLLALAALMAGLLLVLASASWWALESGGVAVLETHALEGGQRSTHVWFVELDGVVWLEAGTPESAWLADVGRDDRIRLVVDGESHAYRAEPDRSSSHRPELRAALREKYGLRDWWVGVLFDTARSIPVRLVEP